MVERVARADVREVARLSARRRTRRSRRRPRVRCAPPRPGGAAPAPGGSAPRGTRAHSASSTSSTWSRPIASAHSSGPRGWLSPSFMPVSMSAASPTPSPSANADSLITWQTIRPSTSPGASPTHATCLPSAAKKRSARVGGERRGALRARQLDEPRVLEAAAARGSRPRCRPGRARESEPLRAQHEPRGAALDGVARGAARRLLLDRRAVAFDDQRRQHAAARLVRAADLVARARGRGARSSPASTPRRRSRSRPRPRPPGGSGRRRVLLAVAPAVGDAAVVVVAAAGLAPVQPGGRRSAPRSARGASAARRSSARRSSSRPRSPASTPTRSISSNGPMRKPPSMRHDAVDRLDRRRSAPASMRSASRPNGRLQRLTRKPGPVGRVDHASCPSPRRSRARSRAPARRSCSPAITSSSAITGAGLKKCMPTTRSGWLARRGDRGHRQRGGVRREHAVLARRSPTAARRARA